MTQLTPPFPGSVKPARVGVYARWFHGGIGKPPFYSRWDGRRWYATAPTPAIAQRQRAHSAMQNLQWAGLATKPQGKTP